MSRIFKSFNALRASPAAASSSSAAAAKFCAVAQSPTAASKITPISPTLGQFLGVEKASPEEAIDQIFSYIKSQNLRNPKNKDEIFCDEKLKTIFEGKAKICDEEIAEILPRHFLK